MVLSFEPLVLSVLDISTTLPVQICGLCQRFVLSHHHYLFFDSYAHTIHWWGRSKYPLFVVQQLAWINKYGYYHETPCSSSSKQIVSDFVLHKFLTRNADMSSHCLRHGWLSAVDGLGWIARWLDDLVGAESVMGTTTGQWCRRLPLRLSLTSPWVTFSTGGWGHPLPYETIHLDDELHSDNFVELNHLVVIRVL